MIRLTLAVAVALAIPVAARADERTYCPDRPGMNTPPCTIAPGRISAEMSLGDWTRENDVDVRTDTVLIGDAGLRYGIADHAELRVAWTAFGHVRSRDKASGTITRESGTGDVTLGIKRNLFSPDMAGFSVAVLPSLTLPAGGHAIGAGDWGAELQVPVSVPLGGPLSLAATPEIDAAVNSRGSGRHLAWGSAAGLSLAATGRLNFAFEAAVMRDDDPEGAATTAAAGIAAGWMVGGNVQFDLAGEFGLNDRTPGLRLYGGVSRRF